MRIAEENGRLVLSTPWSDFVRGVLGSLVFLAFSYLMVWAFARDATLTCTRLDSHEIQCRITESRLGRVIKQVDVRNPQRAIAQSSMSGKGGMKHRLAFVTEQGTVPFTAYYSGGRVDGLVDQFNSFIASPAAATLTLRQPSGVFPYIAALAFAGAGLAILFLSRRDTFTLDRARNTVTATRFGVRGRSTREASLTGLKTEVHEPRGRIRATGYNVYLLPPEGGEISVELLASSAEAARVVADRIQQFLQPGGPAPGA